MKVKIDKISLGVGLIFILVSAILLFDSQTNSITAQSTDNKKNENNNGAGDLTTSKTKINLIILDIKT